MKKAMNSVLTCLTLLTGAASALCAADAPAAPNPLGSFLPLIAIFVIFYLLLIRPQQKKAKEHQKMLNALKKDDKVITSGGIYGSVVGVKGEVVELKIAENVKIQLAKSAVSTVLPPENPVVTPEIVK